MPELPALDTILHVDDNEAQRYAVARQLRQAGFQVMEAGSGRECLERLRNSDPALIILDVRLPDCNGFELCREIKANPKTGRIPVMHLSASYMDIDSRVKGLESGADAYLTQEVHPSELVATARALIRARRAEEERQHLLEQLRITEKLAATGRMAATIAHEINNPMASVTNLLYLLSLDQQMGEPSRDYVRMAQNEVARMSHIVKQMLGFYRDSSHPVSVRLSALMDEVLALYSHRFSTGHVRIDKQYDDPREVVGYPGELRQLFSNLVVNAVEATGSRTGKIRIRVRTSRDWKNGALPGVRVTVADNGSGIEPHLRRNIFEPFFTTKGEKGTGLGLWVSHGIVGKHGGRMQLRSSISETRHGTAFSVFIPYDSVVAEQETASVA
jgi:signal transduction histidine kinase